MSLFVGLLTTPASRTSLGVEVNAPSYRRAPIRLVTDPLTLTKTNREPVRFPEAQESWGVVGGFALYDEDGNQWGYGSFTLPYDLRLQDYPLAVSFSTGALLVER